MRYRLPFFTLLMTLTVFISSSQKQGHPNELSQKEQEFITILLSDSRQGRAELVFDPVLHRVARERARDMAMRNYFSHTNPDGIGPNHLLREAGYVLPGFYGRRLNDNNVESIGGGYSTAAEAYNGWLNSPGHRRHLLGEIDFWRRQTHFGIGYYYNPNSVYQHYWAFITAPKPGTNL
ncbi:MAG: CAP domain-containing protein [Bacteroidales bacterium]